MSTEVTREIKWQLCYQDSLGGHTREVPDRTEEAARERLARARTEVSRPDSMHVHRIEIITTSEQLDW